jgi:outer membrane protein TolC
MAEKQVRVDVQNAIIGLQQSRGTYQAAVKQRILEEQTLDAEQKKLDLGASTIFNVILVQRDLAAAQSAEVAALGNYTKARVQMDFATAQTLVNNNISVAEAFQGQVARAPSALPPAKP